MIETDLFAVGHPDDAEVMLAHAIAASQNPVVVVATNGEASTIDMVGAGADLSRRRLLESRCGLTYLGVPEERQRYLELPDSHLITRPAELDAKIANIIKTYKPNRIFTTGQLGYDLNPDHIAVHASVLRVIKELGAHTIDCFGLDELHEGELVVPWSALKLGAIAMHKSQDVSEIPERWGGSSIYTPLVVGPETYTLAA